MSRWLWIALKWKTPQFNSISNLFRAFSFFKAQNTVLQLIAYRGAYKSCRQLSCFMWLDVNNTFVIFSCAELALTCNLLVSKSLFSSTLLALGTSYREDFMCQVFQYLKKYHCWKLMQLSLFKLYKTASITLYCLCHILFILQLQADGAAVSTHSPAYFAL